MNIKIIVILYNIRSVYNTASCFRTADGAGADKIYLVGTTPSPLDRFGKKRKDFIKVSLGAEENILWEKIAIKNFGKLIKELKEKGFLVVAIEQHKKSEDIFNFSRKNKNKKLVLIMGNEVDGIPNPVLEKADKIIEIPMRGKKESLNVSVAFGIAVYTLM